MTVLVFGGSSQIGHYLLPLLAARDEPVVTLSREAHASTQGVTWLSGQLPDAVPKVEDISAIFSLGPLNWFASWLSTAALPHAPRVIVVSSMSAETKQASEVSAERDLSQLIRSSEATVAEACAKHGSAWTVLRPTLIYGVGMDKSLTPIARRAMRLKVFPLPAAGGMRQPVHAQDLAHAALAALDKPAAAGRVLAVGGGERLTVGEMFVRVRRSLPVDTLPLPLPAWLLHLARRSVAGLRGPLSRLEADLVADNTEMMRLLGVQPRPFRPDAECWRS
ncbi:NAD-dependent epimerase/dehydratase family protein [Dyella nitratireducens]|uniref:Nucleoside-diphosphate sugar epimerase n=1 Tax=Dyella nitratireducens TaxID=1849580 RepID=A0ABQ1G101_9GAMM|nr:NAD-dependent epimerase/dehydratase family protein [Dyella nitratireducens]GGA34492.1 nucleoside-diphosphate sugar epimerase [Dyella nitratireducens]GLQ40873.1 nucleoside-diphosphate sugar epimerase [Dyella nitratireducens]